MDEHIQYLRHLFQQPPLHGPGDLVPSPYTQFRIDQDVEVHLEAGTHVAGPQGVNRVHLVRLSGNSKYSFAIFPG